MKYLFIPLIFYFQFSYAVEEEITSWFNQESEKFLEIMNNSDGQNNENYNEYVEFVENNFAVKSIAYGLIPESVLSKSDKSDLKNYEISFQNYITKFKDKPNNERLRLIIDNVLGSKYIQKDDLTIVVLDS